MKKLRLLGKVLKQTGADKILMGFIAFVFVDALIIFLCDPAVTTYGDALWYCCATISTAGYGDVVATTFITKLATVLLMVYGVVVIAIVTGVIVNFYGQIISLRQKDTLTAFADKLERLPELSKEELCELSDKVKAYKNN